MPLMRLGGGERRGKGPPKFLDFGGCAGKAIFKLKLLLLLHVFGLGASSGRFWVFWGVPTAPPGQGL